MSSNSRPNCAKRPTDRLTAVHKEIAGWAGLFGSGVDFARRIETRLLRADVDGIPCDVRVQFWVCPNVKHRNPTTRRETVRWMDDVAHCMEPGCFRTSANTTTSDYPGLDDLDLDR